MTTPPSPNGSHSSIHTHLWTVVGCLTGLAAAALVIVLAMVRWPTALAVVALLLGVTSIKLLGDRLTIGEIEGCSLGYVKGVRETVDRLAAALRRRDDRRSDG